MVKGAQLTDHAILEISEVLKSKKTAVNSIVCKYSANNRNLYVDCIGIDDIPQDEEYFENIEENLMYANLSWFSPLCNELNKEVIVHIDANIDVHPDGNMDHSKVKLVISAAVFERGLDKQEIFRIITPLFTRLLPFRFYIKNVTFKGHEYSLKKIIFELEIDGRKVNSIISNKVPVNRQILSQWVQTLNHILDYNKERYKFLTKLPMINGKMSTASFESTISFQFIRGGKR